MYVHVIFLDSTKLKIVWKKKTFFSKHVCLYSWDYTINHNKNEDENEKYIT